MKILLVLPLNPWFKGGVENVVKEYSKKLMKSHSLTIVCTSTNISAKIQKIQWMNVSVIICKSYIGILRLSPELISYVRKEANRYDILVIHNYSTLIPAEILAFKKEIHIPVVFTPHFHSKGSSLPLQIYRQIYDALFRKFFLGKIDAFQFVSKTEKSEFTRKFPIQKPYKVIYNGINVKRFRLEKSDKVHSNEKIILFVGRLEKYKNIEYVLKALQYIPEMYKFYIIGEGSYHENIKKLVQKLKLRTRVVLLGSVTDLEYVNWMRKASLFVQPSTIESFGLTVLEALASGVKCIVNTNSYGLQELQMKFQKEIIGLKMTKGTEKKLSDLIENISYEHSSTNEVLLFDWKNQARQLEKFYKKILSKS